MSKLSFLIYLNNYSDSNPTNNPSNNNFKWTRNFNSLPSENAESLAFDLQPGESKSLFSGTRALGQDGTTIYSIALKPLSTHTYVLTATAGAMPNFRTPRSIGADATTQVSVTRNGNVTTFTSVAGTAFNFATTVVGDFVRIGDQFNPLNRGEWKIIGKTSNSISVVNDLGTVEGPITLGSTFANFQVYSSTGVQIGDTLVINSGFSLVTRGTYKVTSVGANFLEFYFTGVLPQETGIQTQVIIYSEAKQLIYLESDKKCDITINGTLASNIEPFIVNDSVTPGVFLLKSTVYSLEVTNNSTDSASLFFASVE